MARLLLGVSGGVAAYKSVLWLRLAMAEGHRVRVIQTENSKRFIGPETFQGISGAPVLSGEFDHDPLMGAYPGDPIPEHRPIAHLALVENADAFLIAPATANTIARLASGQAGSLLEAAYLAAECPVLLAPAMNHKMWHHPATQRNVETLRSDGVQIIGPDSGSLASIGEAGDGRLVEPSLLLAEVNKSIGRQGKA